MHCKSSYVLLCDYYMCAFEATYTHSLPPYFSLSPYRVMLWTYKRMSFAMFHRTLAMTALLLMGQCMMDLFKYWGLDLPHSNHTYDHVSSTLE